MPCSTEKPIQMRKYTTAISYTDVSNCIGRMTAPAKNASIIPKIRLIAPPHTMEVNAASDALFSSPAPSLWLMTTDAPPLNTA